VQANVEPALTKSFDQRLEVLVRHVHCKVDVAASLASFQPDLRLPQPDSCPLPRKHPDRVSMRPALDHRQPELIRIEAFGALELGYLEHELGHAGDGRALGTHADGV
jgi:hypothetical protein